MVEKKSIILSNFRIKKNVYSLLPVVLFLSISVTLYFVYLSHEYKISNKTFEETRNLRPQTFTKDFSLKKSLDYDSERKASVPVILWYNMPLWIEGGYVDGGDYLDGCPYRCDFITNVSRLEESAAVIIHTIHTMEPLQHQRPKDQIWVFFVLEPPLNYITDYSKWDRLFNWTMTYRLDSDIPITQHSIAKIKKSEFNLENLENKTKSASWAASHCNTSGKRENYVKRLDTIIPIDIYGACGPLKCPKYHIGKECYKVFSNEHKFYLSFENSFCRDYVSEKVYFPLSLNTIPVVRGASFYDALLPPQSYINTAEFRSAEDLGRYLIYLSNNNTSYKKYFEWKKYYESKPFCCRKQVYCNICKRLHNLNKYSGVYESVHDWWIRGSNCTVPNDI